MSAEETDDVPLGNAQKDATHAASAVMAETIPPCINLIILGFVANLSIGGLFIAGLLPAGLMALALIVLCIILGKKPEQVEENAFDLVGSEVGASRLDSRSGNVYGRNLPKRFR